MRKTILIPSILTVLVAFAAAPQVQAQPGPRSAPEGLKLQIIGPSIEISQIPKTVLHLRFVNGTAETFSFPGLNLTITFATKKEGWIGYCQLPNDSPPGPVDAPLLPGKTLDMSMDLATSQCTSFNYGDQRTFSDARSFFVAARWSAQPYEMAVYSPHLPIQEAQSPEPLSDAEAIFAVINHSAADWNRGDLAAFATSYKNSPDILFLGRTISRGYDQMLAHYKAAYPTPERMGQLAFTQLEVQNLDSRFATVTGHFHLDRTPTAGGPANGFFLLVVEKTSTGWKIIRDDTTPLPDEPAK